MNRKFLVEQIFKKKSLLCVGLDPVIERIPNFLKNSADPIFEFNKKIIDATHDISVAYKPNLAFYEVYGINGYRSLAKTIDYIKQNYPNLFVIADAKRGDIGNTSGQYAKAIFEGLNCDAITISPYMGYDSVSPFIGRADKWAILLALTSNKGSEDFQLLKLKVRDKKGNKIKKLLYEHIIETSVEWGSDENMMYVIGATKAKLLLNIRKILPNHFLLIPGVGTQGGDLEKVLQYGLIQDGGLLINASRSIMYAGNENDFDEKARFEALKLQTVMEKYLFL